MSEQSPFGYPLGAILKDQITGFQGVVTARDDWLTGCVRYRLTPPGLDDSGKPLASDWVDEPQVEVVELETPHNLGTYWKQDAGDVSEHSSGPGGPRPTSDLVGSGHRQR